MLYSVNMLHINMDTMELSVHQNSPYYPGTLVRPLDGLARLAIVISVCTLSVRSKKVKRISGCGL